ncbi:hypothetical protein [Halobaculum sp. P14]|uniref:hypothetical protein n=1 Tax=Halobaculum sp. P14 TaxID=3421638 RepID=UPI003EBC5A87
MSSILDEKHVHLIGYGALALILGTSTWSSPMGRWTGVMYGGFAIGVTVAAFGIGIRKGLSDAAGVVRAWLGSEEQGDEEVPQATPDGGRAVEPATPAEVLDAAEEYGIENVRADRVTEALEQAAETGGDRNRRTNT